MWNYLKKLFEINEKYRDHISSTIQEERRKLIKIFFVWQDQNTLLIQAEVEVQQNSIQEVDNCLKNEIQSTPNDGRISELCTIGKNWWTRHLRIADTSKNYDLETNLDISHVKTTRICNHLWYYRHSKKKDQKMMLKIEVEKMNTVRRSLCTTRNYGPGHEIIKPRLEVERNITQDKVMKLLK